MKFSMKFFLVLSIIMNVAAVAYAEDKPTVGEIKPKCQASNSNSQAGKAGSQATSGEKETKTTSGSGS